MLFVVSKIYFELPKFSNFEAPKIEKLFFYVDFFLMRNPKSYSPFERILTCAVFLFKIFDHIFSSGKCTITVTVNIQKGEEGVKLMKLR